MVQMLSSILQEELHTNNKYFIEKYIIVSIGFVDVSSYPWPVGYGGALILTK